MASRECNCENNMTSNKIFRLRQKVAFFKRKHQNLAASVTYSSLYVATSLYVGEISSEILRGDYADENSETTVSLILNSFYSLEFTVSSPRKRY